MQGADDRTAWSASFPPLSFPTGPHQPAPLMLYINPRLQEGVSAWASPEADIWRREGVWRPGPGKGDPPELLRPHHFALNPHGQPVHFMDDFLVPFFERCGSTNQCACVGEGLAQRL